FVAAVHLIHLLLLTALELVLALLTCVLVAESIPLLIVPPLELLALGVLLAFDAVRSALVLFVEARILRRRRPLVAEAPVVAPSVRTIETATVVRAVHFCFSCMLHTATAEFAGTRRCRNFRAAMICRGQEAAITASSKKMMVLLCGHGNMAFVFRG